MRIAFILPGRGRSGGVRCTAVAAQRLLERGHDVRILWRRAPLPSKDSLRLLRERLLFSGSGDWLDTFKGRINSFSAVEKVSFLENEAIIGAGMWSSAQLRKLQELPNPKLQYVHGEHAVDARLREDALRLPIPKVVVASYLKPLVESYGGGPVLGVIHNGIDVSEYFCSTDETNRSGIGTIYSSHFAKDPATIIRVLRRIKELRPEIPIKVFGAEKRPKGMGNISYWRLPSVAEARKIYSSTLVWILASRSEGFPAPPLEAMACGSVVVATDCGGTRDIITDQANGCLVPVGGVEQIVSRALMLLDDEGLRKRFRRNATETVRKLSWESAVDALESVLKQICSWS